LYSNCICISSTEINSNAYIYYDLSKEWDCCDCSLKCSVVSPLITLLRNMQSAIYLLEEGRAFINLLDACAYWLSAALCYYNPRRKWLWKEDLVSCSSWAKYHSHEYSVVTTSWLLYFLPGNVSRGQNPMLFNVTRFL
jgi:hypothetical protein